MVTFGCDQNYSRRPHKHLVNCSVLPMLPIFIVFPRIEQILSDPQESSVLRVCEAWDHGIQALELPLGPWDPISSQPGCTQRLQKFSFTKPRPSCAEWGAGTGIAVGSLYFPIVLASSSLLLLFLTSLFLYFLDMCSWIYMAKLGYIKTLWHLAILFLCSFVNVSSLGMKSPI